MDDPTIGAVERAAAAFLQPYVDPNPWAARELLDALRPREADWAAVFHPDWVEAARAGYAPLWDDPQLPDVNPGQTRVRITAIAQASVIAGDAAVASRFPGGFRRVLGALRPDPVWVCWSFTEPDEVRGMSHNGLVAVGPDRWAWFPKPWRALRPH